MKLCYAILVSFLALVCISGCASTPTKPVVAPPVPCAPQFPTMDKPLFAQECYFMVPDGKNHRGVFIAVGDEGNLIVVAIKIRPEGLVEFMKDLEPALKAQNVDRTAIQLVCFPKKGERAKPPQEKKPEETKGPSLDSPPQELRMPTVDISGL